MKRRDALKRLGIASAAVVATPTFLSLLNSCTTEKKLWQPQFFSIEGGKALVKITDVILPKTELPSASELNIPEFIDRFLSEVYTTEDQLAFKSAYDKVLLLLKEDCKKEIAELEDKDIQLFLDKNLKVKGEKDTERLNNPEYLGLTISECLNTLKSMCIRAYIHTEQIGENVLPYDPVPGAYYCDDLDNLTDGQRWSLP